MRKKILAAILTASVLVLAACSRPQPQPPQQPSQNMETETQLSSSEAVTESPEAVEADFLTNFDEQSLAGYFDQFDRAAFLISDGEATLVYNQELADTPLPPYSTFKIPNSIIALETKVISADDSKKKWDGVTYSREVVNQDHDLASAFENSVVWYYKELAREIGPERMQEYLERMDYGNQDISGGIDEFWLGSSLEITPVQQLQFIENFYYNLFEFSDDTISTVKQIMKQKDVEYDLFGKSGSSGEGMSWYVGYLEIAEKPYFFVTYIEDQDVDVQAKQYTINLFTSLLESDH